MGRICRKEVFKSGMKERVHGDEKLMNDISMPSSSVDRVFGHQWLSRWLKFRRSRASRTGKWKDSHPAVVEHDCPEINSSQRWCLCKKTPMWFGATETWAAAGLLSLAIGGRLLHVATAGLRR